MKIIGIKGKLISKIVYEKKLIKIIKGRKYHNTYN